MKVDKIYHMSELRPSLDNFVWKILKEELFFPGSGAELTDNPEEADFFLLFIPAKKKVINTYPLQQDYMIPEKLIKEVEYLVSEKQVEGLIFIEDKVNDVDLPTHKRTNAFVTGMVDQTIMLGGNIYPEMTFWIGNKSFPVVDLGITTKKSEILEHIAFAMGYADNENDSNEEEFAQLLGKYDSDLNN